MATLCLTHLQHIDVQLYARATSPEQWQCGVVSHFRDVDVLWTFRLAESSSGADWILLCVQEVRLPVS